MARTSAIQSVELHSPAMIDAETRAMLCSSGMILTAGHVMALALAGSPYIYGGQLSAEQQREAMAIVGREATPEALSAELRTAFRVFEIIPSTMPGDKNERLSPEWFADVFAAAARAMPSLTWADYLQRIPMVVIAHLAAAAYRAAGGTTCRPENFDSAFAALAERTQKRESAPCSKS